MKIIWTIVIIVATVRFWPMYDKLSLLVPAILLPLVWMDKPPGPGRARRSKRKSTPS